MAPSTHAVLGPSSAHRWLACTASTQLIEDLGLTGAQNGSEHAQQGTMAHALAERRARARFNLPVEREDASLAIYWAQMSVADQAEMGHHVKAYVDLLEELAAQEEDTQTFIEERVDCGIEGVWGTADAIQLWENGIRVVDLKYGQGVFVEAEENVQLMLYGLGALDLYGDVLGDTEVVELVIAQPRLGGVRSWTVTAAELRRWRTEVAIPAAAAALAGTGEFRPSAKACQWCPARGRCEAQVIDATSADFAVPPGVLTPEAMAEALALVPQVKAWLKDLEEAALTMAYQEGVAIPGYKVVRSGGRRFVTDPMGAVQRLIDRGWKAEQVSTFAIKGFGELEKLVGKEELAVELAGLIEKSDGKEALVPESDRRASITQTDDAAAAFGAVEL